MAMASDNEYSTTVLRMKTPRQVKTRRLRHEQLLRRHATRRAMFATGMHKAQTLAHNGLFAAERVRREWYQKHRE